MRCGRSVWYHDRAVDTIIGWLPTPLIHWRRVYSVAFWVDDLHRTTCQVDERRVARWYLLHEAVALGGRRSARGLHRRRNED